MTNNPKMFHLHMYTCTHTHVYTHTLLCFFFCFSFVGLKATFCIQKINAPYRNTLKTNW